MLLDKLTVNVSEKAAIYIEIYDGKTPEEELKYGDTKYDEDNRMLVWYGLDSNADLSGWVDSPWNDSNYSAAIIKTVKNSKSFGPDVIYRIMNNDIDFDEQTYNAMPVE